MRRWMDLPDAKLGEVSPRLWNIMYYTVSYEAWARIHAAMRSELVGFVIWATQSASELITYYHSTDKNGIYTDTLRSLVRVFCAGATSLRMLPFFQPIVASATLNKCI